MFRLIYALEKRLQRTADFLSLVAYYHQLGHSLRNSIRLARNTL